MNYRRLLLALRIIYDQKYKNRPSATSQPAFGIKKARLLEIKICSLERQKEVVMLINEKMSVCDQIEITIKKALLQAESMRQSILKKAFEGGLV